MTPIQTLRFYLLKMAYPMMRLSEKLHFPEPKITAEFYYSLPEKLLPGDILLSKEDSHVMTNIMIPGFWAHAAIYCGETKYSKETVVEAVGAGVVAVPLVKWVLVKDHVAVLRFKGITPELGLAAAKEAVAHVGEPYDYQFSGGNSAWYCAEIAWYAHNATHGFSFNPSDAMVLKETFGVSTVTPEDFWRAKDKLDLIAVEHGPANR